MARSVFLKSVYVAAAFSVMAAASPVLAASCIQGPAKMSDDAIKAFIASPNDLLMSNMKGGLGLSNAVRQLVASDSSSLDAVMKLVNSASPEQASAIAAGLARAVQACSTVDAAYADQIQRAVAGLNNPAFLTAFNSTSGQISTAALQGGTTGQAEGGGSTGSGGSSQTGGTNGRTQPGSNSFSNPAFTFASTTGQFVSSPTQ